MFELGLDEGSQRVGLQVMVKVFTSGKRLAYPGVGPGRLQSYLGTEYSNV